jgi:hypothetical protein
MYAGQVMTVNDGYKEQVGQEGSSSPAPAAAAATAAAREGEDAETMEPLPSKPSAPKRHRPSDQDDTDKSRYDRNDKAADVSSLFFHGNDEDAIELTKEDRQRTLRNLIVDSAFEMHFRRGKGLESLIEDLQVDA